MDRLTTYEWVNVKDLSPHPSNPNKHSEEQIDRIAKNIKYQGWRHPIIVSARSGYVVAGHGRIAAAKKAGFIQVPVQYQAFDSDDQEVAFLVSDNSLTEGSKLDWSMINAEIPNFGPDFDLDMLGLKDFKLDPSELDYSLKENKCPHCGSVIR